MKMIERLLILVVAIVVASPALAGVLNVDCTKGETVTKAVEQAKPGDTIQVTGTCKETVTITTDRLTLDGQGSAILDGGSVGKAGVVFSEKVLPSYEGVLTIVGARGVTITGFTIQHGVDGITCKIGAACIVRNTILQDNADEGIQVSHSATAEVTDSTLRRNAEWGIVVVATSSVVFRGTIISTNNGRDGIGVFFSSHAHVFAETTIQANNNARSGISVAIAASMIVRGTIMTENNGRYGVSVGVVSHLRGGPRGTFIAKHNKRGGLRVNDGASVTLSKATVITDNNGTDVALSFGARATLKGNTIGTITCDKSSMIRGDVACPE
ncbi:MAG: nitrous oxide reductase family maturation protein NosD [bacterium]